LRPLSLAEQVDKGLLMIGSDDADGAHNLLSSLRDKFAASPSAEEQFLGNVADYWLAVIEGDPERAAMVSRRAEQIEYRGSLTRRFRIPPAEPQRSVDIEFEAIMTRTTLENRRPHPSRSERD